MAGGDHPGPHDLLVVIDVVEEGIECLDPLLQPGLHGVPLMGGNDARHDIEGNQTFLARILAIHGKGDADPVEGQIGLFALARDHLGWRGR